MKGIKRILLPVLLIVMLVMSFALTSCDNGDNGDNGGNTGDNGGNTGDNGGNAGGNEGGNSGCAHTWGEWSTKTAATCTTLGQEERACSLCSATDTRPVAATGHSGTAICTVCGSAAFVIPEIDAEAWNSIGFELKDFSVAITEDNPVYCGTMTMNLLEAYVALDENGALTGYGKGAISAAGTNTTVNNTYNITMAIEAGVVYIALEGAVPETTSTYDANQYIKVDINNLPQLKQLEESLVEAEPLMTEIMAWYTDTFAPIFANVDLGDGAAAKAFATKVLNAFFVKNTATDGTSTLTFSLDAIKEFNEALGTKKISELIDYIIGEGVYNEVKGFITSDEFYALSVADALNYIETTQGVDLEDLFDAIDALLVIVMDTEGITLEAMLASSMELPEGFDIVTFIKSEEIANLTVMDALLMAIYGGPVEDDPTTDVDELEAAKAGIEVAISSVFTKFESVSFYELMMAGSDNDDNAGVVPVDAPEEIDPIAAMVDSINEQIDAIAEYFSIVINIDANGAYVNTVITVTAESEFTGNFEVVITATASDVEMKYAMEMEEDGFENEASATFKIIPGKTVTKDADKIAAIKAAIANASVVDKDIIIGSVVDELDDDYRYYTKFDETTNVLSILVMDGFDHKEWLPNDAGKIVTAYFTLYQFHVDNIYNLSVIEGCTDVIYVTYNAEAYEATGKGEVVVLNSDNTISIIWSYLDNDELDAIIDSVAGENLDIINDTYTFTYNTETEEVIEYGEQWLDTYYDVEEYIGHTYEIVDAESVIPEGCTDIGKNHYKCATCGDEFDFYYINGHSVIKTYTLNDETAGPAAGYTIEEICYACGGDYIVSSVEMNVISDVTPESYSHVSFPNRASFKITIDETTAGTYNFYSVSDDYCYANVTLYRIAGSNPSYCQSGNNSGENSNFYLSYDLAAGETYVVMIQLWGSEVDAFDVYVERAAD